MEKDQLPWWRALSFNNKAYCQMFDLTADELQMNILDCHAGTSAFIATLPKPHLSKACDPLYAKSTAEITPKAQQAQNALRQAVTQHRQHFGPAKNVAKLLDQQGSALQQFLADFPPGLLAGHYRVEQLPALSFQDEEFDLALVSHYLFIDSAILDLAFHLKAIQELTRIANEVRIFPLVTDQGELSPYVGEVIANLQKNNLGVEIRAVPFELQKNGNAMLRIWTPSCTVSAHHGKD